MVRRAKRNSVASGERDAEWCEVGGLGVEEEDKEEEEEDA